MTAQLLKTVLTSDEYHQVISASAGRLNMVARFIESKFVAATASLMSGRAPAEEMLGTAQRIQQSAKAVEAQVVSAAREKSQR